MRVSFESLSAIKRLTPSNLSDLKRTPIVEPSATEVPLSKLKRVPIASHRPEEIPLRDLPRTPIAVAPEQREEAEQKERAKKVKAAPAPRVIIDIEPKAPANVKEKGLTVEHTESLLKALIVIMLKTYGQDTKQFTEFTQWIAHAKPLLTRLGLQRTITVAANTYKMRGLYEDELVDIGKELRAKSREGAFDGKLFISPEQRKLLRDIMANFKANPSDNAWNRIHTDVRILNDVKLNRAFIEEEKGVTSDLKKTITSLRNLVKKVTGRDSCFLTTDEAMELRKDDPATAVKISGYSKQLRTAIKKALLSFIRTTKTETSEEGTQIAPIDAAQKYLSQLGLPNNLPIGLTGGKIDELGRIYTAENHMLAGIPEGRVVMNPAYNPETHNTYVCKVIRTAGRNFEYRTLRMAKNNKSKKFGAVQEFLKDEAGYRQKWIRMLGAKKHIDRVLAAMMELMYVTSARIGGKSNETAGEKTYGLTTLLVKHIKVTSKVIEFDYTGKKGANQGAHFLVKSPTDRLVRDIMLELINGKGPDDLVFTSNRRDSANGKPVFASTMRTKMEELGIPITPHKFRHAIATKMAMEILATAKFKKGTAKQAEVERWVKAAMIDVGKQLHHRNGENETSSTALKSYISHDIIIDYFNKLSLHPPAFLRDKK